MIPKKKILAVGLASALSLTLLPNAALAVGSAPKSANPQVTLSEQYLFAGSNGEWYTEESYRSAPVVTDLDGDGTLEVLNAAYSLSVMDAATGTEKWRINAGKDRSSEYSNGGNVMPGQVFCDFKVLDIDGDGKKEIVIAYGSGIVSVLDNQGYFKPGWPQQPTTGSIRSLAVDDLDGDGKQEIIVGAGVADPVSVWVYHCDGTLAQGWPQLDPSQNGSSGTSEERKTAEFKSSTAWSAGVYGNGIATGDLNGDGLPEIIVPTDTAFIDAYYYDGSLVDASPIYNDEDGASRKWGKIALYEDYDEEKKSSSSEGNEGWGFGPDDQYHPHAMETRAQKYRSELAGAATTYTDLDGDGKSEIVISSLMTDRTTYTTQGNNKTTIADTRYMTVFVLNQDRSRYVNEKLGFDWSAAPNELTSQISGPLKSSDPTSMSGSMFPVPVCADLDGDGYQEILFNSYDGKVHCFSLDKSEWSFTLPKSTGSIYEFATPPVCVDLDGNGTKEVIFASWTDCEESAKRTDIYGGTGVNGALYVLSSEGDLLASMDLHNGYCTYEDRNNPSAGHSNGVMGSPVVQDIDGDGKYEVLLNTTHYALCAYEINVTAPGAAYVPTIGGFDDVKADMYYKEPVLWAVNKGITQGTGAAAFSPEDICTHIQIITFLWRAAGRLGSNVNAPVSTSLAGVEDYVNAANWAYENGIIDEDFNPNAPCTRADTVNYMWKAKNSPTVTSSSSFTDVPASMAPAVNWAVSAGVTQGTDPGVFSPDATCTRGQIVTFLYRAFA